MKSNILVVLASPRKKGNSAALAAKVVKGAEAVGAVSETVYLNSLGIKPCQGCEKCQKPSANGCIIDDKMQSLYPKLAKADAIILASPIYWFNFSAQAKIFIDRLYAVGCGEKNIFKGKNMAVILTFADPDPFVSGAVNALRSFQDTCRYLQANLEGMVYGCADKAGEIKENKDVMEQGFLLGKHLAALTKN
ncbi:MAG: flavodoxin family protein [Desulfobacteraceae bacterium]|nr:flavodoxin family protein [Desulfobacteraceae bacterium]